MNSKNLSFVSDFLGNNFECKQYKRIISLVPSITELLFDFGLENRIIGVTKYCNRPSNARILPRTVIGGTKNPDIGLITSLHPDLIIINKEENKLKDFTLLRDENFVVFVTYPRSIEEAVDMIEKLMNLLAISNFNLNNKLMKLKETITEIKIKTNSIRQEDKVRYFCPIWKNPWMSFNQDTFASSILELCGGVNVFSNHLERYPRVSIEEIIQKDPEIILLPNEPYNFTELDKKEIQNTSKLRDKEVILVDGTFHWYSFQIERSLLNILDIFQIRNT